MKCPYCGKEMRDGSIPVSGNYLAWHGKNPENALLDEVPLVKFSLMKMQEIEAFYCSDCRRVIIPVPEFEDFYDKMKRKVDGMVEKFTAAKDDFMEQREEKKERKEKEKRAGKDPWEL